jgi:hypothetical protein
VDIEVLLYPQAVGDHVSHLELCKSKALSWLNAAVVFDGWTPYNGSKLVDRAWSNGRSLGETGITTTEFATGLIS